MIEIRNIYEIKPTANNNYFGILKEEVDLETRETNIYLDGVNLNRDNPFCHLQRHITVFNGPNKETKGVSPIKYSDVKKLCGALGVVIYIENDRSVPSGPAKYDKIIFLNNSSEDVYKSLP